MSAAVPVSVQEVQAGLVVARDAQITRIVAMVDAMPVRGEADALIAPLRQRLAQLRPARPFGFVRLLFTPLDPAIVPAERWRPGTAALPRPALAPMGAAVQAAMGLDAGTEAGVAALAPEDREAITALGRRLWPASASVLKQMAAPPGWAAASGLSSDSFAGLATAAAAILAEAAEIERMAAARTVIADDALRAMLDRVAAIGGNACAMLTVILLARLPAPDQVLRIASGGAAKSSADDALEQVLARVQGALATRGGEEPTATEAALDAARVAALLSGMEADATGERRRKIDQIRRDADQLCLGRFERAAASTLAHAAALAADSDADTAVGALEDAARDLRRLEAVGRKLGSAERYDATLHAVAGDLRARGGDMPLADRVRLVEILCGPDAAMALLSDPR